MTAKSIHEKDQQRINNKNPFLISLLTFNNKYGITKIPPGKSTPKKLQKEIFKESKKTCKESFYLLETTFL